MSQVGMTAAELRVVFGKNVIDLTDEELDRAKKIVTGKGLEIISIASPLLKCVLPDAPDIDSRFQQDAFAAEFSESFGALLSRVGETIRDLRQSASAVKSTPNESHGLRDRF